MILAIAFSVLIALLLGVGELGLNRTSASNETLSGIASSQLRNLQVARQALAISNDNNRIVLQILLVKDRALIDRYTPRRSSIHTSSIGAESGTFATSRTAKSRKSASNIWLTTMLLRDFPIVGERLQKISREQDTVARLGGDEFLVVLAGIKDIPDAAVAAERLMDAMTAEFVAQGHALNVSCSIGISIYPEHGTNFETLIKNADTAMYSAKESGRENFRFFT